MKLISARQAWHDCFYSTSRCTMDRVVEQAKIGAWIQNSTKLNTCNAAAHQVQAGLVQSAITTLPAPLQKLGHWLYAPESFIPADAEYVIWKSLAILVGLDLDDEDSEQWYLIRAAMRRYRELVWQRPDVISEFRSPRQIKHWLWEWHGVEIQTRRWAREYGRYWDRVLHQIDVLDEKALGQVAVLVARVKSEEQAESISNY